MQDYVLVLDSSNNMKPLHSDAGFDYLLGGFTSNQKGQCLTDLK